jgi:anti-sigma regulatory factor (Ser/Thr protein kinase)
VRLALGDEPFTTAVQLVVSELATNAVRHAHTSYRVCIQQLDGVVRVEVTDGGARMPRLQYGGRSAIGGRGLVLVDNIATAWGVSPHATGKTVWADIAGEPLNGPM